MESICHHQAECVEKQMSDGEMNGKNTRITGETGPRILNTHKDVGCKRTPLSPRQRIKTETASNG